MHGQSYLLIAEDEDDDCVVEAEQVRRGDFADRSNDVAVVIKGLQKTFVSCVYTWLYSNSWAGAVFYESLSSAPLAVFLGGDVGVGVSTYLSFLVIFGAVLKFIPVNFRLRIVPTREVSTFSAVRGVSYAIEDNSCFFLLGHNVAGKALYTLLLKSAVLQLRPDFRLQDFCIDIRPPGCRCRNFRGPPAR
mmetsp:Transcript_7939/g.11824  ORF Transcript_7939/g.11824 Transcript_7939/m.11824 type:complete len:190 (-) Transcript_7939:13-582(-)